MSQGVTYIIYVNGEPATKYEEEHLALADFSRIREKFKSDSIELKKEVCQIEEVPLKEKNIMDDLKRIKQLAGLLKEEPNQPDGKSPLDDRIPRDLESEADAAADMDARAYGGEFDEGKHWGSDLNYSVLFKTNKDDQKISVAQYDSEEDANKFLQYIIQQGGNGIIRSNHNKKEQGLDEKLEFEEDLEEGSGPKEKEHSKYVNRSSPASKEAVARRREEMAAAAAAKPGQELLDRIKNKGLEEGLDNGYKTREVCGSDFFPDGADSPVVDKVGPSGAKQGDNPEQKRMMVAELHKDLVYKYRKFLNESNK